MQRYVFFCLILAGCGPAATQSSSKLAITLYSRGFGTAMATGDFNKDGIPDIAIGQPDATTGGRVHIYSRQGETIDFSYSLRQSPLDPEETNDDFGNSLAAGDFNGDGYTDLAVGVIGDNRVWVFKGSSTGLKAPIKLSEAGLDNEAEGDNFGRSLAAGDFNGDGLDDLAVGAEWAAIGNSTKESGAVFLFKGNKNAFLKPDRVLDQAGLGANEDWDVFGQSLVALDYNKDGIKDLAVGALYEAPGDQPGSGAVFVYKGGVLGLSGEQVLDQQGLGKNENQDWFGFSLAAGDINSDGYEDLAVGANMENQGAGAVFTFKGGSAGLKPWQLVQQDGLGANEKDDDFGYSLALADYNGDGKDDLAVGAPYEAPGSGVRSGAVFIYRGGSNGVTASKVLTSRALKVPAVSDYFGYQLLAGDMNQDGRADLLVGAPDYVFAFKGQADDFAGWTTLKK